MPNQITTEYGVKMDIPTETISFSDLPRTGVKVERARYVGDRTGYDVSYIYVRVNGKVFRLGGFPDGLYRWRKGYDTATTFRGHLYDTLRGSGVFLRGFFDNLSIG